MIDLGAKGSILFAGTKLVGGLQKQNEQVTSLARNLNLARARAEAFRNESVRFADEFGKPVSFLLEGMTAVNAELGTQGMISLDSAKQFSTLTHRLGLSADEAARLFNASSAIGESFTDLNADIAGNVRALNSVNSTAIDYKQIMKDIGSFSSATLLTQNKFEGSLTKAAFTARKLGLEMSGLENIAGNLLNFEESIASELEAELLTGKQLNLDNARLAALKGDMTTLAEELNAQNIDATTFGEMNVLQQEAVAKAMGMGREEMAKMLSSQEAINKVAEELNMRGFGDLDLENQIAALKEQGYDREQALRKLGKQELADQELNRSVLEAQKEFFLALEENIEGDSLNTLVEGKYGFKGMSENMKTMRNLMYGLAGAGIAYYTFSGIGNMIGGGMFGGKGGKMMKGGGGLSKMLFGTKVGGQFMKGGGRYAAGMTKGGLFSGVNNLVKGGGPSIKGMGTMFGMGAVTAGGSSTASAAGKTVASNITKGTSKTVAKSVGKSMLKKIPIVGTLAGIGFGISRAMQGDYTGAALEVASGLAANIPGAGTAISAGIDLGLAGRDIYKGQSRGSIDQSVKEVGVVADNQNKFQAEQLKILNKIEISNQKLLAKNSDTYLNGSKVSDQLALNANVIT